MISQVWPPWFNFLKHAGTSKVFVSLPFNPLSCIHIYMQFFWYVGYKYKINVVEVDERSFNFSNNRAV